MDALGRPVRVTSPSTDEAEAGFGPPPRQVTAVRRGAKPQRLHRPTRAKGPLALA